ncbi:MAG TPA: DUF3465 domain-containing protein [Candidatus Rubrimentiphilum sp.]|nr:DUF3465 domain-containing protein [Candidatus Rubrimentiphilum sp.]
MVRKLLPLVLLALTSCAVGPQTVEQAMASCARGASAVEVVASGKVAQLLGTFSSPTGQHEGFTIHSKSMTIRIEDNVSITGPIPLTKGEPVTLQGVYECNDGVIHWTHHDPRGRHMGGYIQAGGKIYR